jgi:hypothetical protein
MDGAVSTRYVPLGAKVMEALKYGGGMRISIGIGIALWPW